MVLWPAGYEALWSLGARVSLRWHQRRPLERCAGKEVLSGHQWRDLRLHRGPEGGGHRGALWAVMGEQTGCSPGCSASCEGDGCPRDGAAGFSGPAPLAVILFQMVSPTVTEKGHPQGRGGRGGDGGEGVEGDGCVPWKLPGYWTWVMPEVPLMLKCWTEPSFWSMWKKRFYLVCWM